MRKILMLTLALGFLAVIVTGCRTNKGAQEFIPGRGWQPTR